MKKVLSLIIVFTMLLTLRVGLPAAAEDDDYSLIEIPLPTNSTLTNIWNVSTARSGYPAVNHSVIASPDHYCTPEITAAAGDVFFFGPCDTAQNLYVRYWNSYDGSLAIGAAGLTVADTFDNGQVIYQYAVPGAGKVSIVARSVYNETFFVSKNRRFTVQEYYNYWDAKGGNLYRNLLDKTDAYLSTDGSYVPSADHNCTHYIAVSSGNTITFGPAKTTQDYHLYGFNSKKEPITGMVTQTSLTVSAAPDENAVFYTYTVPAGVSYVRVVNYTAYEDQFIVTKNNVFDLEGYYALRGVSVRPILFRIPEGELSVFYTPQELPLIPEAARRCFYRFNGRIMRGDLLIAQDLDGIYEITAAASAGDMTNDAFLSIADAVAMLRALNRGEAISPAVGDVSGNGMTDSADVAALMRVLNG